MMMTDAITLRTFQRGDEAAIWALMLEALDAGELQGTTRSHLQRLVDRCAGDPDGTILLLEGERMAGLIIPHDVQLIVGKAYRRRGYGRRLVEAGLDYARNHGDPDLRLAAPEGNDVAIAFLTSVGFAYHSSLWLLTLPLDKPVPFPAFPSTVVLQTFDPDGDLAGYVDLINTSFADHASPIQVTEEMVRHIHALPDFNPRNIALIAPADALTAPVGFCVTGLDRPENGPIAGRINLVGVLPAWRGKGLGRELLRWGVAHLRTAGAEEISLAVEAVNDLALGLYERNGFERAQEWRRWACPV
jgi:mycothiol synthase